MHDNSLKLHRIEETIYQMQKAEKTQEELLKELSKTLADMLQKLEEVLK